MRMILTDKPPPTLTTPPKVSPDKLHVMLTTFSGWCPFGFVRTFDDIAEGVEALAQASHSLTSAELVIVF